MHGEHEETDHLRIIFGQDLFLADLLLQLDGQVDLLQLALDGLLAVQNGILHQLLRDRRTALNVRVSQRIHDDAGQAAQVDAVVIPEALVLNGHRGVHDISGQVLVLHLDAVLVALEVGDEVAVLVVDIRGLRLFVEG